MGRDIDLTNQGTIDFFEARGNGTAKVTLRAPSSLAATFTVTLPTALPAATEALLIDSSGNLSTSAGSQAYGSIFDDTAGGAGNQALATQNTYYQLTAFSENGAASGITASHTNNDLTVPTTGTYLVNYSISFSGTASETYAVAVYTGADGATTKQDSSNIYRALGVGGDVGAAAGSCIVSLTATNKIELWATCTTSNTTNINPHAISLSAHRVA
jgi:hypothetical protein